MKVDIHYFRMRVANSTLLYDVFRIFLKILALGLEHLVYDSVHWLWFKNEASVEHRKPCFTNFHVFFKCRLDLSQLEDLHWHEFCVTWSGLQE